MWGMMVSIAKMAFLWNDEVVTNSWQIFCIYRLYCYDVTVVCHILLRGMRFLVTLHTNYFPSFLLSVITNIFNLSSFADADGSSQNRMYFFFKKYCYYHWFCVMLNGFLYPMNLIILWLASLKNVWFCFLFVCFWPWSWLLVDILVTLAR